MRRFLITLLVLVAPLCWGEGNTQPTCLETEAAKLISLQGKLLYDSSSQGKWQVAQLNQTLCEGSRVKVEANSRVLLQLPNGIVLRLFEGTVLSLNAIAPKKASLLDLAQGFVHFISRTPKRLQITTPIANAGPEGTEFALRIDDNKAELWVYEGGVKFFNDKGNVHLSPGQGAQAQLGQAPRADIDIKPLDAVAWALYYPPLLPYPAASMSVDSEIRQAIMDFRQGHIDVALSRLDSLPSDRQSPYFYKVRAAIRLSVGLDKLALQDIQLLLASNPNDAEALALQSVRLLVQNHKDEAYALAKRAVIANPSSATAYSALSYAEQGRFDLDKALQAADTATKYAPHDAMVWARKAELELTLGQASASSQSAHQALGLDANLERTQTVTGFAYLLRMDTDEALQSFERAVKLDSSSPLARLGLGLAKIRKGNLQAGRQDLEIAAILDPANSLIRSYLGKAYYEENRNGLAEDQFNLAKERDPKDPTPYFYDALKKQTENRPVEALQNLQKAIALNDNRAVYRSKQLLDSDRAARGASLARIYDTLGFEQRGILEASKSLATDPTNYSAHRFLSDSYVRFPARGSAQTSELLQAQLLQPININPIQPHLAISSRSMPISTGVSEPLFRDFSRVFERNKPQFTVSGLYGNLDTGGDEAVLTGIHNNISYSLGQFHFGTDGFRDNADISHDIYNAFIQVGITDKLNTQLQYLHRESKQGDLIQQLDTNNYQSDNRFYLNQNTVRFGAHYQPNTNIDLLASIAGLTTDDKLVRPSINEISKHDSLGISGDVQLIWKTNKVNYVIGGSAYTRNYPNKKQKLFPELEGPNPSPDLKSTNDGHSFYGYTYVKFPYNILGAFGLSYVYLYKNGMPGINEIEYSRWQPKLGISWEPVKNLSLRFAFANGLKPSLFSDQTIEPTQLSGFNQLFDDFNGDASSLYATAIDYAWHNSLFFGIQASRRDIDYIGVSSSTGDNKTEISLMPQRKSDSFRSYLNWMIAKNFSLVYEYIYEKDTLYVSDGVQLNTHKIPISVRYFNAKGFFSSFGVSFINQDQTNALQSTLLNHSTSFVLADAAFGYRLPNRLGIVSLEVKNIFDRNFIYNDKWSIEQSDPFQMSRQQEFLPTRTILARILINY